MYKHLGETVAESKILKYRNKNYIYGFLLQKLFCGNCWMDRAPSISLMGSPALDYLPRNQNRLKISKLLSCQTRFSPPLRFSPEIQKAQISMLIMFMAMMMPMKMIVDLETPLLILEQEVNGVLR